MTICWMWSLDSGVKIRLTESLTTTLIRVLFRLIKIKRAASAWFRCLRKVTPSSRVVAPSFGTQTMPETKKLFLYSAGISALSRILYIFQLEWLCRTEARNLDIGVAKGTNPTPRPPRRSCSCSRRSAVKISPSINESPKTAIRTGCPFFLLRAALIRSIALSLKHSIATLALCIWRGDDNNKLFCSSSSCVAEICHSSEARSGRLRVS